MTRASDWLEEYFRFLAIPNLSADRASVRRHDDRLAHAKLIRVELMKMPRGKRSGGVAVFNRHREAHHTFLRRLQSAAPSGF